jgi:hypothetical protein
MTMPTHPDQDDPAPTNKPLGRQAKVVVALILALLIAFIALHLAGVFGP